MHVLSNSEQRPAAEGAGPLLRVTGAAKRFGSIQALDDVDFEVGQGEICGLCGHNGAGKSTLVKVLTGLESLDRGEIFLGGSRLRPGNPRQAQAAGIALVDQELSVVPTLSVLENLFVGDVRRPLVARRGPQRAAARDLLKRVGLDHLPVATPAARLAIGERQLLEIARALSRGARLLILDEPTATLSRAEIEHVFRAVRDVAEHGCSVVFISHRLDEVLSLCSRVTVMRDGRVVGTHGGADLDRPQLVRLILGEAGDADAKREARRRPGETVLRVGRLRVPGAVDSFRLDVRGGQIVGLAGQIGSGASEVLRALAGLSPAAHGEVRRRGRRVRLGSPRATARSGIAFVSADRKHEGLFLGRATAENLVATRLAEFTRFGVVAPHEAKRSARELAALLEIDPARLPRPTADLSGGNQQKVFIGRCLQREDVDVMLLDEPTRGVDVGGRAEIHGFIRAFASGGRCALFASTELDELLDLADVIVTMFEGRMVSIAARDACTPRRLLTEMTTGVGAGEERAA